MAILRTNGGEGEAARYMAIPAHCLVGRSSACTLRVHEPKASREHARMTHEGAAWTVRDLGTTNGTFVNGERLPAGAARSLAAGDRLGFGDTVVEWILFDASPPAAMARRLDDDAMFVAEGLVLALPSGDLPLVSVLAHDGAWVLEMDGQSRPARDGEVISLQGAAYMLHLPEAGAATDDVEGRAQKLARVELKFRVSRDEERVEVTVMSPAGAFVLAPRAHHYPWLTIARARLKDRSKGDLAEDQHGWVNVDDLCSSLKMDETHLNVAIYRIRKDIATTGLLDGANVIERRRGARQVRLGTPRVSITIEG